MQNGALAAESAAVGSEVLAGDDLHSVSLEQSLAAVQAGMIVVIGENHGLKEHQTQQVAIMKTLRDRGLIVSVGMEFFSYPQQNLLDQYRAGALSEVDFLKTIQWGSPSFDFYRDQALFARASEGAATVALNMPRTLTGKVSKEGLSSLTAEELSLMPPQFSLGRDSYKKRFLETMGGHLPSAEAGDRYFAAQSIWDDTMAWKATDYISRHPNQVLVIVVGEFHVQYDGGLPDRIHARSPQTKVVTFSQINSTGMTEQELSQEITPSDEYGARANYLWVAPAESLAP